MGNDKNKIKNFFKINDNFKIANYSFLVIFVAGFIAYYLVVLYGFTNPDGINEGFYYYTAADWASAGCGRWLIRYFNMLHGNTVMPLIMLLEYFVFIWLTLIIVFKLLRIKNIVTVLVSSVVMIVTPGTITHMPYAYTASAYAFACLLSTSYVYFVSKRSKLGFFIGTLCLAFSMGLYQSYIGQSAVLVVMYLCIKMANKEELKNIGKDFIWFIVSALLAVGVYYGVFKIDLFLHNLVIDARVGTFSVSLIFKTFISKFFEMYKVFTQNFLDGVLKRNYIICVIGLLSLIVVTTVIAKLIKEKEYSRVALFTLLILLLPPAAEIIGILIPYNNVNTMMSTQNYLIFPFILSLLENRDFYIKKFIYYPIIALLVLLSWTYVLSANATYRCYKLSYNHINSEMNMVLNDIYHLDGYIKDETPVMLGGFPDDKTLREELPLYNYTIELYPNVVFWQDMSGVINGRYNYFLNCFGINAGEFSSQEYYDVMTSDEFKEMSIWPKKDSVKMIDGFAVVKFREDPLLPSE